MLDPAAAATTAATAAAGGLLAVAQGRVIDILVIVKREVACVRLWQKTHSIAFDTDRCPGPSSKVGIGASAPPLPSEPDTISRRWSTDMVAPSSASAVDCDAIRARVGGGGEFGFRKCTIR